MKIINVMAMMIFVAGQVSVLEASTEAGGGAASTSKTSTVAPVAAVGGGGAAASMALETSESFPNKVDRQIVTPLKSMIEQLDGLKKHIIFMARNRAKEKAMLAEQAAIRAEIEAEAMADLEAIRPEAGARTPTRRKK